MLDHNEAQLTPGQVKQPARRLCHDCLNAPEKELFVIFRLTQTALPGAYSVSSTQRTARRALDQPQTHLWVIETDGVLLKAGER